MAEKEASKAAPPGGVSGSAPDRMFVHRIVRYAPSPLRDEWINIGVLLFDPKTGERRLRLIEEEEEYNRVRRLHPQADETLLRGLQDDLENRFETATRNRDAMSSRATLKAGNGSKPVSFVAENREEHSAVEWLFVLEAWDRTLSHALRLADPKATRAQDLDSELARLYNDRVAAPPGKGRAGLPASRSRLRSYCAQVFRHAKLWNRLEKSVRAAQFTFPGDPMLIDYSYRRNGTRGFVQTLPVTRAPADAKLLAYTVVRIRAREKLASEFTAVTDVPLECGNDRHGFVRDTLLDVGIEPVPLEGFAVWVAKLRPMLQ